MSGTYKQTKTKLLWMNYSDARRLGVAGGERIHSCSYSELIESEKEPLWWFLVMMIENRTTIQELRILGKLTIDIFSRSPICFQFFLNKNHVPLFR